MKLCDTCGYPGHSFAECRHNRVFNPDAPKAALKAPVSRIALLPKDRTQPPMPKAWHDARWMVRQQMLLEGWRPRAHNVQLTVEEIATLNKLGLEL